MLVDSRTRSVQSLNVISEVLFGSDTAQDPVDSDENKEDQNNWEESGKQTGEGHACRILTVDDPDQPHADHEKQNECSESQANVCLF